jgi:hypothetical protein
VYVDPSAIISLIAAFVVLAAALVPVLFKKISFRSTKTQSTRLLAFLKKIDFPISLEETCPR